MNEYFQETQSFSFQPAYWSSENKGPHLERWFSEYPLTRLRQLNYFCYFQPGHSLTSPSVPGSLKWTPRKFQWDWRSRRERVASLVKRALLLQWWWVSPESWQVVYFLLKYFSFCFVRFTIGPTGCELLHVLSVMSFITVEQNTRWSWSIGTRPRSHSDSVTTS